jgi:hypothetical protein
VDVKKGKTFHLTRSFVRKIGLLRRTTTRRNKEHVTPKSSRYNSIGHIELPKDIYKEL